MEFLISSISCWFFLCTSIFLLLLPIYSFLLSTLSSGALKILVVVVLNPQADHSNILVMLSIPGSDAPSLQIVFFCPFVCLVIFFLDRLHVLDERNCCVSNVVERVSGGESSLVLWLGPSAVVSLHLWSVSSTHIAQCFSLLRSDRMAGVDCIWMFPFSHLES